MNKELLYLEIASSKADLISDVEKYITELEEYKNGTNADRMKFYILVQDLENEISKLILEAINKK